MIDIDILLAWGATYKILQPNETLFKEGSSCSFYYQIVSGQIRWVNINEDGKEYLQTLVEQGQCLGELPLFDDEVYAATAIANKETYVLRLHKNTFHQLLKSNPDIHFQFSKLLTQRLRFKFFLVKEISQHDPKRIIIALLQYMKHKKDHVCPDCNLIKLTRQQIADMTGLRVETVIRTMRLLHEEAYIEIKKGKVFLRNMIEVIP